MEKIETIETTLQVDNENRVSLTEAAKWARFLGILGFIGSGFLGILTILMFIGSGSLLMNNVLSQNIGRAGSGMVGMIGFVYLIITAISFIIALLMYRFGVRTLRAISFYNQADFNSGISNLRMLFRIYGIFAIIYLAITVLLVIISVLGALFA